MKQFFCELLFICAAQAPGAQPLDELTYGTVLYEYYQQDFDAALLNTLIAEEQGRLGDEPIRFELAKGSFAFAGGMYDYANEIFESVPDGELTDLDRMRLAFHLSREYHRRGDWDRLSEALARIELGESWLGKRRVHPEVEFMRAELASQQKRFDDAAEIFAEMDETHPLRAYGLFNLGIALREESLLDTAEQTFQTLADMPAYSDEAFDLSQRAKLALALIARQQESVTEAETVLASLPGEGRYQDVAMAAYGGLAMDTEDYELAARIWMTLKDSEYWTASTATARLGFPLSLEKMAESGQRASTEMALMQYRRAEESFAARHANLRQMSLEARDPNWVRGLLEVFAVPQEFDAEGNADPEREAQMRELMERWEAQLGHTDWLEWLATDQVHQALVQWRELNGMNDWLDAMPDRIDALTQVAHEQQRRGEQAKTMLVGDGLLAQRSDMVALAARLAADIDRVRSAEPQPTREWMMPLANEEERSLLDELGEMRTLLVHMNDRDREKWSARIRRLEGVFFYQIVDERAARLRALEKTHGELLATLTDIDERIARVQVAEENFVAGVGTDFELFVDRAQDIVAQVDGARRAREALLANEIRSRMQDEMHQVEQYLLVTRIAIARATDQLALAGDVSIDVTSDVTR